LSKDEIERIPDGAGSLTKLEASQKNRKKGFFVAYRKRLPLGTMDRIWRFYPDNQVVPITNKTQIVEQIQFPRMHVARANRHLCWFSNSQNTSRKLFGFINDVARAHFVKKNLLVGFYFLSNEPFFSSVNISSILLDILFILSSDGSLMVMIIRAIKRCAITSTNSLPEKKRKVIAAFDFSNLILFNPHRTAHDFDQIMFCNTTTHRTFFTNHVTHTSILLMLLRIGFYMEKNQFSPHYEYTIVESHGDPRFFQNPKVRQKLDKLFPLEYDDRLVLA
jgi:hypothetical protein